MATIALIVAAGSGSRLGGTPKQFRQIGGRSVLAHAVDGFIDHPAINAVRVVVAAGQEERAAQALDGRNVGDLVLGGKSRSGSVRNGLAAIEADHVLIHDAARMACPAGVSDRLLAALDDHAGAVPFLPSVDTLARRHAARLGATVDRDDIVRIQTPQAFRLDVLRRAYAAWDKDAPPTDEGQVVRVFGASVALVEGDAALEKLTTKDDWKTMADPHMISRTGLGYDVHAFAGEGPAMLGGIPVPHDKGLKGHSDADVLLHAITDALLGAAALGDIGDHFPPSEPQWKGAASDRFLDHAATLIRERGGVIDHVDATLICEAPKIGPHREAMRRNIARILDLPLGAVSVKATTSEQMGFTGRREGIACQAVATIRLPQ